MQCCASGTSQQVLCDGTRAPWNLVKGEEEAGRMKQVLGIRDENARMKVMPPLAELLLAHEDDMRWKRRHPLLQPLTYY